MKKISRQFPLFAFFALVFLMPGFFSAAQSSAASPEPSAIPTQIPGQDALLMGTAWYPEQWPESRWEEDLKLMEAANIKVVRVGEFG
jgi:beta-galactosidase